MPGRVALLFCLTITVVTAPADEPKNLNRIPSDLSVPMVTDDQPAAGRRFRLKLPEHTDRQLAHVLYLPSDWKAGEKYPVLVEFPGNGGYENRLGDKSTGLVEDCKLGYGISGGKQYLWLCLPFVEPTSMSHTIRWWGDPDATATYCRAAAAQVCREFGGDPDALILCGFSRGALACGYIGLRDDQTAKLWRVIIAHSHFDGVRTWNYPDSDAESARRRLGRLGDRPLYVSHEESIADIEKYLNQSKVKATLRALPYPNHTDEWVLKDIPERAALREWLSKVLDR